MKRNGAYIFQNKNFSKKNNQLQLMNNESEQELFDLFLS
jgi:hypothetical protein